MIISKKQKIVFIKGRKVGSTSFEILLSKYCGSDDIITPITPKDEIVRIKEGGVCCGNYHKKNYFKNTVKIESEYIYNILRGNSDVQPPRGEYYNHMSFEKIESLYGRINSDWDIVAIDRNPYNKIISKINMMLSFKNYDYKIGMATNKDAITEYINNKFDVNDFLDVRNIDSYKDKYGVLRPKIIKFENMNAEIKCFFKNKNLNILDNQIPHAKKGIQSKLLPIDVFSRRQLDEINNSFEEEFVTYGYDML